MNSLWVIFLIFLAACIETDVYLPAFPDMMSFFKVSESQIQQVLSWNFIGLCVSSLFYGPISDQFGRKRPLVFGLSLFVIGSFFTVFSDQFGHMLFGRVLQGLGSGSCFAIGTAIIFDVFPGKKAMDALNKMNTVVPFLLAGAPLLGGFLNLQFGFRSNFILIGALAFLSLVVVLFFYKESLPVEKKTRFDLSKILQQFKILVSSLDFWKFATIVSLSFAVFLAFLSITSIYYVLELNVSKTAYPFYQAALLIPYLIASLTCSYTIEKFGVQKTKKIGLLCLILAAISSIAVLSFKNPLLFTLAMMPFSFGFIYVQTPFLGDLMEKFNEIKGAASSLLTSFRLLLTAFIVWLSGDIYMENLWPQALLTLTSVSVITLAARESS